MPAPDPALLFPNPPLDSLNTAFAHLALRRGLALKFPRDITPFAALIENSSAALADLHLLLEPSESTFAVSFEPPHSIRGIAITGPHPVRQFEFPADAPLPHLSPAVPIEPIPCAHAAEMVELTSIAFPGYFRIRTCEMGPYFGIRSGTGNDAGRLIAMCGERMNVRTPETDFREISGLCTHPDHRGQGHAAALLAHMLHLHRAVGQRSYLHVASNNSTAIALYQRLGFLARGEFPLYSVRRSSTDFDWRQSILPKPLLYRVSSGGPFTCPICAVFASRYSPHPGHSMSRLRQSPPPLHPTISSTIPPASSRSSTSPAT